MLTANAAREKSAENIKNSISDIYGSLKEFELIEDEIEKAVLRGEFRICGNSHLTVQTVSRLRSLGYDVECNTVRGSGHYVISW